MTTIREVKESPLEQGVNESIFYDLTTTPWGGSPTSPVAKLYVKNDDGTLSDVTATNMPGSPTVAGNVITSPTVVNLAADKEYRLDFRFVISGKTEESYLILKAKR